MAYVARRPITLYGKTYRAREVVPLDGLNPVRRRQLIEQRRVVPHVVERAAVAQVPEPEAEPDPSQVLRCSELTKAGSRCKRDAGEDGICGVHRGALARMGTPNESTED